MESEVLEALGVSFRCDFSGKWGLEVFSTRELLKASLGRVFVALSVPNVDFATVV